MPGKHSPDITDEMLWAMCDLMSDPIPLVQADLTKPFIYERQWGVFYTPFGRHQAAMGLLLAWQHDCKRAAHVIEKLGISHDRAADYWLEHTPGAAFRSSVGKKIQVASIKGLTIQERRMFSPVCCAFE